MGILSKLRGDDSPECKGALRDDIPDGQGGESRGIQFSCADGGTYRALGDREEAKRKAEEKLDELDKKARITDRT